MDGGQDFMSPGSGQIGSFECPRKSEQLKWNTAFVLQTVLVSVF